MTLPTTMAGVQLLGHGGPEMLRYSTNIPVPIPGPGQALVKVVAAGVNNTDINTRVGWYAREVTGATDASGGDTGEDGGWSGALKFPLIQGGDLCGTVVALGEEVTNVSEGMRVIAPNCLDTPTPDNPVGITVIGSEFDGAFAQYCVVPADHLFDVSNSPLSDTEIGAMPCAFGTAMGLLEKAGVTDEDRVLITGASGGVGMAAVGLARLRGAHVTAMTSAAKADAVRDAGAQDILERNDTPPPQSHSVVIDVVGGPGFPALLDALKPGGRYAVSGAIAGPIVETDLRTVYLNDLTLFGSTHQPHATFAKLVDVINKGTLRPLVSKTYPLADIHKAQEDFASKRYPGKLVLIP